VQQQMKKIYNKTVQDKINSEVVSHKFVQIMDKIQNIILRDTIKNKEVVDNLYKIKIAISNITLEIILNHLENLQDNYIKKTIQNTDTNADKTTLKIKLTNIIDKKLLLYKDISNEIQEHEDKSSNTFDQDQNQDNSNLNFASRIINKVLNMSLIAVGGERLVKNTIVEKNVSIIIFSVIDIFVNVNYGINVDELDSSEDSENNEDSRYQDNMTDTDSEIDKTNDNNTINRINIIQAKIKNSDSNDTSATISTNKPQSVKSRTYNRMLNGGFLL
jgi:hypothetical protein